MEIETIKYSDGDGSVYRVEMKMEFDSCTWCEFQNSKLYRDLKDGNMNNNAEIKITKYCEKNVLEVNGMEIKGLLDLEAKLQSDGNLHISFTVKQDVFTCESACLEAVKQEH